MNREHFERRRLGRRSARGNDWRGSYMGPQWRWGRGRGWYGRGRGPFEGRGPFGPFGRLGGRGPLGPFGPFGPLGPFSPVWRSGVVKYVVAAGVTRLMVGRVKRRLRRNRREPRPWLDLWGRSERGGRGERGERGGRSERGGWGGRRQEREERPGRRDWRARDEDDEQYTKEGKMPRFGRGFPGFEGPRGGRRFDRGDMKYVVLDLLREGPRHGYDMIKELEKRTGGFYSPSPGSVYPTLQMLEDQGLVTSTTVDGKRTYRLTDAGYAFIEERSEQAHGARGRAWAEGDGFRDELRSVGREAGDLARSLRDAVRSYTPDSRQIGEIRDVLGETRKRIEAILAERRESTPDEDRDKPTTV